MATLRLTIAVTIATSSLVACAGDNGGDVRTATTTGADTAAPEASTSAPVSGDAILIEERITDARLHTGVVLETSVIGESAFCRGGTTTGGSEGAAITETFHCPGGTLVVRFAPKQNSLVQGALWEVVTGTGSFEGLRGGGSMVARFDDDDPDTGQVTFAGTVGA